MPHLMQPPAPASADPRGDILQRLFDLLESAQIPYCVLHGYATYPHRVPSDVDLLMPSDAVANQLAELLLNDRQKLGADVVLWLDGPAHYVVLAGDADDGPPAIVQLHVSTNYVMGDRVLYDGGEILASRRHRESFRVPAAGIEFACVLCNRILKQGFRDEHRQRLSELMEEDPAACQQHAGRFFGAESVGRITRCAQAGEWRWLDENLPRLRSELLARVTRRPPGGTRQLASRIKRWITPTCGLHAVFLGPDGVGKSTVIESVRRELSPVFLHEKYLTFAPGLLPSRFETPKPLGPHSLPPRSYPASLVKAAWWAVCYTLGYLTSIHPTRARAGWVVNHRYLPDAIVDQKRYRYSGPIWPLRALWKVAPKPDLLFLLDAPAEVIQARKKEVAPEETRRQRQAYRDVVAGLPFARVIDASQPLESVVRQVERAIIEFLRGRVRRQRKRGGGR